LTVVVVSLPAAAARTDVPPTRANFVWAPMGERTLDWASGCADGKVIVRPFAGHGSRVTIGTPDEKDQFLTAAGRTRADLPRLSAGLPRLG
jgi:histidinol-phosphate/aromatic aminotransferase/cobyric acid decarboxylase-like protein